MRGHHHHRHHHHHAIRHERYRKQMELIQRRWGPAWRIGIFVAARLHRRLFVWTGFTILVTGLVVGLTLHAMTPEGAWQRERRQFSTFVGGRFAEVWSDPGRLSALTEETARDLDVPLRVTDDRGALLAHAGGDSCRHDWFKLPVKQGDRAIGQLEVCIDRHLTFSPVRVLLVMLLVLVILWAAAGRIAWRFARPLSELARVAQELGQGNLSARANLHCNEMGEVGVLADAFNDMASRIERQIADQRELLAGVSHELRTPLARIRLLIELSRETLSLDRLDEIEREVIEIDQLVGELLASSRLDFAALTVKPLDAVETARRALERAGLPAEKLEVAGDGDWRFEADPTLVARALANLLDNARKHGNGLKTLRIRKHGEALAFEADDEGEGFAPEQMQRLFQPFTPAAEGQTREHGSLGLGLALVQRIALAHGGRAYVENRAEGGARVGFELSATPPRAQPVGSGVRVQFEDQRIERR